MSIVAGIIGELCAAVLLKKNHAEIAALTATFSLIQFYEAYAYHIKETPKLPIQILLGLQGVVFFAVVYLKNSNYVTLGLFLFTLCLLMAHAIGNRSFSTNCTSGCRWEMETDTIVLLILMYIAVLGYGTKKPHLIEFSVFITASLLLSFFPWLMNKNLSLSWWCFVSAIASPIFVLYQHLKKSSL